MPSVPILLLTRPEPQARRFAAVCTSRAGRKIDVEFAPIMAIRGTGLPVDLDRVAGLILSSENGACMIANLAGKSVYCIGKRTAGAARNKGARIVVEVQDADALVAALIEAKPPGPLLHLHGTHTRGDIAERLNAGGIETFETVIYDQVALPLPAKAKALIEGERRVILPLFSPRSARLVGRAVDGLGANLHVIAMSRAVANAWQAETGGEAEICEYPTGEEMVRACVAAMRG